jgi:hypothetical protein
MISEDDITIAPVVSSIFFLLSITLVASHPSVSSFIVLRPHMNFSSFFTQRASSFCFSSIVCIENYFIE